MKSFVYDYDDYSPDYYIEQEEFWLGLEFPCPVILAGYRSSKSNKFILPMKETLASSRSALVTQKLSISIQMTDCYFDSSKITTVINPTADFI